MNIKKYALLSMAFVLFIGGIVGCEEGSEVEVGDLGKADVWTGQEPECVSPRFMDILDAVGPVIEEGGTPAEVAFSEANLLHIEPHIEGPAIFSRMAELIEMAEHDVLFETYEFTPEAEPFEFILNGLSRLNERLIAEQHDGPPVMVYLMISQIATTSWRMKNVWTMINELGLDPNHVQVILAHYYDAALGINHVKSLVVDGRVAIVTGANASEEHGGHEVYYDAGFEMEGEVAHSLHRTFNRGWVDGAGIWICRDEEQWDRENANDCWDAWPDPIPVPPTAGQAPNQEQLCEPMFMAVSETSSWPFPSHEYDQPLTQAFLTAMKGAQERIRLHTPNLNEPEVVATLEGAVRRGVEVELVLSLGHLEDGEAVPGRGGVNRETVERIYQDLAGMDDHCDHFQTRWYTTVDGEVPDGSGAPSSHLKYLSVDGELVVVGSCNMDVQSWHNSRELIVVIDNDEAVSRWDREIFEPSFARSTVVEQCGGAAR